MRDVQTNLRFKLKVNTPIGDFDTQRVPVDQFLFRRRERGTTGFLDRMSEVKDVIEPMEDLSVTCRDALSKGVDHDGWLAFVLPRAENPARKNIQSIRLIATDAFGGTHEANKTKSEWRQSGKIVGKRDEDLRQTIEHIQNEAYRDN